MICEQQATRVTGLQNGDIKSGSGLNQELSLKRPGDTRWGSYYKSLLNVVALFPHIVDVVDMFLWKVKVPGKRFKQSTF